MENFQILVVFLLLSQPSSSARRLRQKPSASEFPPPLPGDLASPHQPPPPPPSPSPQCTPKLGTKVVYFRCPPPLGPPSTPHSAPAPTLPPSPVGPPPAQTSYLYYFPPPPITIPPPAPKFLSPDLSPFMVRTLSVVLGSVLSGLLVEGIVGCIKILIRRWAARAPPNRPRPAPNQGEDVEMQEEPGGIGMQDEMQEEPVGMGMQDEMEEAPVDMQEAPLEMEIEEEDPPP